MIDLLNEVYQTVLAEMERDRTNNFGVYDKAKERDNLAVLDLIKHPEQYKFPF